MISMHLRFLLPSTDDWKITSRPKGAQTAVYLAAVPRAVAMIWVARRLRGGRISYADAFFPIALLHLGN